MSGDDGEGIDFSVITRAIKCGGSMVEQLVNGVHYGTSEVRCLLLDECDLIIECKVCRNLFRALPNFIAHKRVYCVEATQDPSEVTIPLTHVGHNADTVVVEPQDPDNHEVQKGLESVKGQPSDSLAITIQQMQNGTFEGKSDAYKFYTDVANKVDQIAENKRNHYIQHESIPGNPNAVRVSVTQSTPQDFSEEITSKGVQNVAGETVTLTQEACEEVRESSIVDDRNTATNKLPEKPGGIIKSARLRAKSEKQQLLLEKLKTQEQRETKLKVVNSDEGSHNLREKAKKMFLYPVTKTVTDAKDCDLKNLNCLLCKKRFSSLHTLHYHMRSLHSSKREVFPCPLCSTVLKHKWGLTRHLMRTHSLPKNEVDKMRQGLKKCIVDEANKPQSSERRVSPKSDKIQDNKNTSDMGNASGNIYSQSRTRTNSALEKKAKFLVDSAKADSMPNSRKKSPVKSAEDSTDFATGSNDRPKKEFSVKFCSRKNSKSAQFYSGLSLLHCKLCSKAFAKKENLQAHLRVCSSAVDTNLCQQAVNRRQHLRPSKLMPEEVDAGQKSDVVNKQDSKQNAAVTNSPLAADVSGSTANGTSKTLIETVSFEPGADSIISNLDCMTPVKVVLEDCDVTNEDRRELKIESPRRRSLLRRHSSENSVDKRLPRVSPKSRDTNNEIKSKMVDSNEISVPRKDRLKSKRGEERQINRRDESLPTNLRSGRRQKTTNNPASQSEADYNKGDLNNSTELVTKNRMSIRQATKSKQRTASESSVDQAVKKNTDAETSVEGHDPKSSVGNSIDLETPDNGVNGEVSFISDDELVDIQKRLEAQLGQQISEVSQELGAIGRQQGPTLSSIRSVEEIWVGKSPGKPAERLKSKRMYVLDSVNKQRGRPYVRNTLSKKIGKAQVQDPSINKRGRPYCQDSKRIDQLIDEKNMKCLKCGELFGSVSNMRRHVIRHLGWQRYRCKLCSYCSYHKSEMNTHLGRVHGSKVNPLGNSFLKFCMIDLGKEGSRLRAKKRQRTMSNRQAARAVSATNSISLNAGVVGDSGDISTHSHQTDREKPVIDVNNIVSPDPKRFNISTRNSPRVFDTRPVKRTDNMQTLITRKRSYPKQGKSASACKSTESTQRPPDADVKSTSSVSSEESRATTPTINLQSKTRSIDFRKTRSNDNPWVDGFYKRLSGGSLGAVGKQHMMVRPFKNRKGETIEAGISATSSISSENVNSVASPEKVPGNSLRATKSDSSLQTTSPACKNVSHFTE